jgi:hypothetical protein
MLASYFYFSQTVIHAHPLLAYKTAGNDMQLNFVKGGDTKRFNNEIGHSGYRIGNGPDIET